MRKTDQMRLLGQVSGGLAHQLRNGVTGARLAVQLHVRECAGHAAKETLDVALRQLALVEVHLKQFLSLGRSGELRRERCSLTTLIDEAVSLVRPQCRHAGIEIAWLADAADVQVVADAGQLGHLLLNVLSNAIEAAGQGGRIQVRTQRDDKGRGIIEVRDSGGGPSAEVAQHLFEPFVTGKSDGVGLGLAVAHQVALAHGGSIDWRREAGWTCFQIVLPAEPCW
jgi:signal transduction histidine kinase